jgi:amidase
MARFFRQYDVLICPVALSPPIKVEQRSLDALQGIEFKGYLGWLVTSCVISVTGCPVLALPCGFTNEGLPIGLQVIGPPRSDAQLLAVGSYLERLLQVSPRPPVEPR